jgi:hypothetical protein
VVGQYGYEVGQILEEAQMAGYVNSVPTGERDGRQWLRVFFGGL